MEHESPSNWLDAHLDGDGRWADADTAVLVDADELMDAAASHAGVVDAAPPDDGGAWLDHAGTLPGLETDDVDQVVVTDDDLADGAPVDADIVVPEPPDAPAESGIVDPFDDFLARTSDGAAGDITEADESPADPSAIGDDVAPAPTEPEAIEEAPPPAVDTAPLFEPAAPAAPAPLTGYDAFDQLDEPVGGDDWSVDLTPDQPTDLTSAHDDGPDAHDDDHFDGGDLA